MAPSSLAQELGTHIPAGACLCRCGKGKRGGRKDIVPGNRRIARCTNNVHNTFMSYVAEIGYYTGSSFVCHTVSYALFGYYKRA